MVSSSEMTPSPTSASAAAALNACDTLAARMCSSPPGLASEPVALTPAACTERSEPRCTTTIAPGGPPGIATSSATARSRGPADPGPGSPSSRCTRPTRSRAPQRSPARRGSGDAPSCSPSLPRATANATIALRTSEPAVVVSGRSASHYRGPVAGGGTSLLALPIGCHAGGMPEMRNVALSTRITAVLLSAALVAGVDGVHAGAAELPPLNFEIHTLSNRADLISDGDALVEVRVPKNVPMHKVTLTLDGVDVRSSFVADNADRTFRGVLGGMTLGDNVFVAD